MTELLTTEEFGARLRPPVSAYQLEIVLNNSPRRKTTGRLIYVWLPRGKQLTSNLSKSKRHTTPYPTPCGKVPDNTGCSKTTSISM